MVGPLRYLPDSMARLDVPGNKSPLPGTSLTDELLLIAFRGLAAFESVSGSPEIGTVDPAFSASESRALRISRCPCQILPANPAIDGR